LLALVQNREGVESIGAAGAGGGAMSAPVVATTGDQITAAQINAEHRKAEAAAQSAIEHARIAGNLLNEHKARCAHGEFTRWLAENIEFSERTAQGYMAIAREWGKLESKTQRVADFSVRGALRKLRTERRQAKRAEQLRAIKDYRLTQLTLPAEREYQSLRNNERKQWALVCLPCAEFPYTETIYFEPFDQERDEELLGHEMGSLVARLLLEQITSLPIEDIDVNGDVFSLNTHSHPWSWQLAGRVNKWNRIGFECGFRVNKCGKLVPAWQPDGAL
jgi:hypothetical protein